ncbi:MAG TPA: DUF1801 domain-containing protein [Ktedonobacterales bacterium]|nr:DUF1801 domain-containing protein [Ktedonobacterales bacterium]
MTIAEQIDAYIATCPAWQAERLRWFRALVHQTAPELSEDVKWGVGVFTRNNKAVLAFSGFKGFVKFNFFQGARLADPDGLFNSGLESKNSRSINVYAADQPDEQKLAALIRSAAQQEA